MRLPDLDDVKEGIVASKIAAHAADIAKGIPHARDIDNKMSDARRRIDWKKCSPWPLTKKNQEDILKVPHLRTNIPALCAVKCAL